MPRFVTLIAFLAQDSRFAETLTSDLIAAVLRDSLRIAVTGLTVTLFRFGISEISSLAEFTPRSSVAAFAHAIDLFVRLHLTATRKVLPSFRARTGHATGGVTWIAVESLRATVAISASSVIATILRGIRN